MIRGKTSVRSKLFSLINNTPVYFSENKLFQLNEAMKSHLILNLDENTRFSICKLDKSNKNHIFQVNIRNLGQQIQLKVQNSDDLQLCIKYLGFYGIGYGLQAITTEFQKVGKGNFATVYKFVSSYKTVKAMKMFEKKKLGLPKNKLSFMNEVRIMKDLKSRNLASLDCIFETQKNYYLQMEYFQQTLKAFLKRPLTRQKQKKIMKDLLQALLEMKSKNIIHRDIKPDNIMVRKVSDNQEEFVIIDFGLATKLTQSELIHKKCGTPGFIAPEIANMTEKTKISFQCDIFSLGVTFFYILTQKKPFIGVDNKDMLYKNKKMVIEQHLFYYLSDVECDLVKKMMQKDPEKRITVQDALNHEYFDEQIDDNDLIAEQTCDLDYKLKQLQIMDTSAISQGIIFLFSLFHFAHTKPKTKEQYTRCLVDTDFHDIQSDQESIETEFQQIINSKGKGQVSKDQQMEKPITDDIQTDSEYIT